MNLKIKDLQIIRSIQLMYDPGTADIGLINIIIITITAIIIIHQSIINTIIITHQSIITHNLY